MATSTCGRLTEPSDTTPEQTPNRPALTKRRNPTYLRRRTNGNCLFLWRLQALTSCLEAEGLSGAVTIKQNPSWQCVHCRTEFPLQQLTELQEHENRCARKVARDAAALHANPTQVRARE